METEAARAMMRSAFGSFPTGLEPGEVPKYPTLPSKGDMEVVVRHYDTPPRFLDPRRSKRIPGKEDCYSS